MGWVVNATPRPLYPGKTRCPLHTRLDGPQGWSGRVRKISPPPGFDPRTVRPVASRYGNWTIPAHPEVQWHQVNVRILSTRTGWEFEQPAAVCQQQAQCHESCPAADSVPTAVHCATSHAGYLTVSVVIRIRAAAPCVPLNVITWLTKSDVSGTDCLSIIRALNHLNFEPAEGLSVEKAIETAVCRREVSVPLPNDMLRMVTSGNMAFQPRV